MLPSEAHPLCRSDTIFLIAFAVDGGQTSSGPFVMICLHYAQSLFWLERYTHSDEAIDRTELTDAHGHMRSVSDLD